MDQNYLNTFFNLQSKVVVITGATGQLGSTLCDAYLKAGAKVVGLDKILNKENYINHENMSYQELDISNKDQVHTKFRDLFEQNGHVDILINNAGVSCFEPFEERPEESFDWVMDVNLKGTFFCIQEYVNQAKQTQKPGNILNVASFYGVVSPDFRIYTDCERKNSEVYGATKAGVIQMTKYFGVHLAKHNIRVNAISPGGIFNPKAPQGEDFVKNYSFRCPMSRMADAKEMVGAALYLSSEASSYTTGHNLVVDGGMSCW